MLRRVCKTFFALLSLVLGIALLALWIHSHRMAHILAAYRGNNCPLFGVIVEHGGVVLTHLNSGDATAEDTAWHYSHESYPPGGVHPYVGGNCFPINERFRGFGFQYVAPNRFNPGTHFVSPLWFPISLTMLYPGIVLLRWLYGRRNRKRRGFPVVVEDPQ